MRDVQPRLIDGATLVAKDVDIDLSRTPTHTGGPAELLLDGLDGLEEGSRLERGLHLEHLVQEGWLVSNANRLGLGDAGGAHQRDASDRHGLDRGAQVAGTVTEIAPQREPHSRHACRMASAIRATRTIGLTSWTRTMSAPPATLSATAAA